MQFIISPTNYPPKNKEKTSLKHAFENRAIDSDSTAIIELFIRNNYATTESDKKEIENTIYISELNYESKYKILKAAIR